MAKFVLDTNVFIHAIRSDEARRALAAWQRQMGPHLYQHAVVVSELLVGARNEETFDRWHERWVAPAERLGRVITPTYTAWSRAARIITRLVQAGHLTAGAVAPSFFHDCLLAASARDHGYILVTHNLDDFGLIARVEPQLSFLPPFPAG
ncbi:hypothetical protein BH23GEM7_BH23GEM7_10340 [soil metagenome]